MNQEALRLDPGSIAIDNVRFPISEIRSARVRLKYISKTQHWKIRVGIACTIITVVSLATTLSSLYVFGSPPALWHGVLFLLAGTSTVVLGVLLIEPSYVLKIAGPFGEADVLESHDKALLSNWAAAINEAVNNRQKPKSA